MLENVYYKNNANTTDSTGLNCLNTSSSSSCSSSSSSSFGYQIPNNQNDSEDYFAFNSANLLSQNANSNVTSTTGSYPFNVSPLSHLQPQQLQQHGNLMQNQLQSLQQQVPIQTVNQTQFVQQQQQQQQTQSYSNNSSFNLLNQMPSTTATTTSSSSSKNNTRRCSIEYSTNSSNSNFNKLQAKNGNSSSASMQVSSLANSILSGQMFNSNNFTGNLIG